MPRLAPTRIPRRRAPARRRSPGRPAPSSWQQDRAARRPPRLEVAVRARRLGERMALADLDADDAAERGREEIVRPFDEFAPRVRVVREAGAGDVERAHAVEPEEIERRNDAGGGAIRDD